MAVFLYRLNPPRPTFPGDITAEEGAAMQEMQVIAEPFADTRTGSSKIR